MLAYYVDILDTITGGKLGSMITNATEITFTKRLDRAGSFSMTLPSNADITNLTPRKLVSVNWITSTGVTEIGRGVVDRIEPSFDGNSLTWHISGDDILRELAWVSPGFTSLWNGVNGPCSHATAVSTVAAFAPTWTFTADGTPSTDSVYYKGKGDSVLSICGEIARQCNNHFYLDSYGRVIKFISTFGANSVVAVAPGRTSVPNSSVLFIADIEEVRDSYDLITRIYPYGEDAGGGAYRTLLNATRAAPSGYTLSTGSNYIKRDAAETAYGVISRYVQYPEIKRIGGSGLDDQAVSNALFDVALQELQQKSEISYSWRLHLIGSQNIIPVGTTIRVMYRKVINGQMVYNIDNNFNVLESTIRLVPGTPPQLVELVVSSVKRQPLSDGSWAVLAEKSRQFK